MKRIYNDIPLRSVLFTIPGYTHIRIYDFKSSDVRYNDSAVPVWSWEGLVKDSYGLDGLPLRVEVAKVYRIDIEGKEIIFRISTESERN